MTQTIDLLPEYYSDISPPQYSKRMPSQMSWMKVLHITLFSVLLSLAVTTGIYVSTEACKPGLYASCYNFDVYYYNTYYPIQNSCENTTFVDDNGDLFICNTCENPVPVYKNATIPIIIKRIGHEFEICYYTMEDLNYYSGLSDFALMIWLLLIPVILMILATTYKLK
jgi:hypothetical protein